VIERDTSASIYGLDDSLGLESRLVGRLGRHDYKKLKAGRQARSQEFAVAGWRLVFSMFLVLRLGVGILGNLKNFDA
jgi:hypothetical protein